MAKRLPPAVKPLRDATTKQLLSAIDEMQDLAPGTTTEIHGVPETHGRTPWKLAVRFILPGGSTYEDIFTILRDWRDDKRITRAIGQDRLSRIQVRYRNKRARGSRGEYTLAEIGSWQLASSRAVEKVGVRDGRLESLIRRYGVESGNSPSYVESLVVWFSSSTAKEIRSGKVGKAKAPKAKKRKGRRRI